MDSPRRHHRYYDLLLAAFVVVLLCSNFIGAGKAAVIDLPHFGEVTFGAGILFFPIAYFFGDIFTEVYGYAYDRRAVRRGQFSGRRAPAQRRNKVRLLALLHQ
jgi:uncharacterized PurR-regulated membrane protein YhhQ (DUF165 family)